MFPYEPSMSGSPLLSISSTACEVGADVVLVEVDVVERGFEPKSRRIVEARLPEIIASIC